MKKILLILLLIVQFSIFSEQLNAQAFQRTFGDSTTTYTGYSRQTGDGGYIISGYFYDPTSTYYYVHLVKTDASGNLSWSKKFEGADYGQGNQIQQTSDSGYVIVGYTQYFGAGYFDVYLIKTDANGNLLWSKIYGMSGADYGYFIQQTSDGGYIIVGSSAVLGSPSDVYLIKIDANGNLLWSKTYGGPLDDVGYCVRQTTDGGYIISGRTESYGTGGMTQKWDVYLLKTDSTGNLLWSRSFGVYNVPEYGYSVQQTSDGGYIITGMTAVYSYPNDVYLIKTDANGNLLWSKAYGENNNTEAGFSVQQTNDNGFIIGGYIWPLGGPTLGGADVYLIKTDSTGNHLWSKIYGGASGDWGRSVQQTTDGGYVVSGETYSFGVGNGDFYLIKTDPNGNSGCNEINYPTVVSLPATIVDSGAIVSTPATVVITCNPAITSGVIQTDLCVTLTVSVISTNITCNGLCDGTATSVISGGTPPFTYLWNTGDTSSAITGLCAGIYYITVTDLTLNSDNDSTIITEPPPMTVNITGDTAICSGDITILTASGGNNYLWSTGDTTQSITINPSINSNYSVIAFVGICSDTANVTVTVTPVPIITVNDTTICSGQPAILTASGASTYVWSTGSINSSITISPTVTTTYTVTGTNSACTGSSSGVVTVNPINAGFSANPKQTNVNIYITFQDNSGGNIVSWQWDFGDGCTATDQNCVHQYADTGTYTVTLIVTDANGCIDSASDIIEIRDIFTLYIPNSFTPNGDEHNDFFYPQGINVDPNDFDMYIFDRWGNLMFHTNTWVSTYGEPWNGKKNNIGTIDDVIMDVYVYRILAKEMKGPKHEYIGRVALIR